MNLKSVRRYVYSQLPNSLVPEFQAIENKKLGVSIRKMPAKIDGCFQDNFTRLTLIVDEFAIGKTCNGSDFMDHLRNVKGVMETAKNHLY